MTRSEKNGHHEQIEISRTRRFFRGHVAVEAQSPKLIEKIRSEGRRAGLQLTEAEYIEAYMPGRRASFYSAGELRERKVSEKIGRRRRVRK